MCGIAGFVGPDTRRGTTAVQRMLAALARRGPDGEGLETFPQAVLGHRRLSIFDLSDAGRQPMLTPDGQIAVVFNGAVYNFLSLRAELEKAGYSFRSRTDTEVLLHGYVHWGIDGLLHRLRGMFALGLWDNRRGSLFLVRDRLGVKPLYYTVSGDTIAFASTARALRSAGLASEIDPQAVAEFLEFGYVTDGRSIYQGVAKVAAGTFLEWNTGQIRRQERYWAVPQVDSSRPPSFDEAVERTETLLLDAVAMRLEADVPVGALLSGGIDSALVCWAIAQKNAPVTAFTVSTPGDPWDETEDARLTAQQLQIRHEIIPVSSQSGLSLDEALQQLTDACGEPFACASALGMIQVSRAVRSSATVLLTGDGGDDVFLGYPEHKTLWTAQKLGHWIPRGIASGFRAWRSAFPGSGAGKRARNFLGYATGGIAAVAAAHPGLEIFRSCGLLGPRFDAIRVEVQQLDWSPESARRLLADFLEYEHRTRFTGEYMTKVDSGTMFYALEARAPFLDQEIWNYAARLPFDVRLAGGTLKAILREIARRRIGPRVSTGAKRGFGIPVARWLAGSWESAAAEMFEDSLLKREGWISAGASPGRFEYPDQLWYTLVLEAWMRKEREAALPPTGPAPEAAFPSRHPVA